MTKLERAGSWVCIVFGSCLAMFILDTTIQWWVTALSWGWDVPASSTHAVREFLQLWAGRLISVCACLVMPTVIYVMCALEKKDGDK